MNVKDFFFKNFGIKVAALIIAVLVWILITGKQRTYEERTFEVSVEYFNVSPNIDVRSVRPDKARIKIRGTTKETRLLTADNFKIRVDLGGVLHSGKLNLFTEDYLELPGNLSLISVHPKMIEIGVEEFLRKEVPVKVWYRGRMPAGVALIDRRVIPDKVKIFGYKSQIKNITTVNAARDINLAEITSSRTIRIPLEKTEEILRFEDTDSVEVFIEVKNNNEKPKK